MSGLHSNRDEQPYHVTLTTADGLAIDLISVGDDDRPIEFDGVLTPVDATEQFRPGGIPREFSNFEAGAGYTFYDERVPNGYDYAKNVWTMGPSPVPSGELTEIELPAVSGTHGEIRVGLQSNGKLWISTGRYCVRLDDLGVSSAATVVADFSTLASMATNVFITSACLYLGSAYWGGHSSGSAQPLVRHTLSSDTFTSAATCSRLQIASFYGVDGEGTYDQWMVGTVASNAAFKYTNSATPMNDANWTPGSADGIAIGDPSVGVSRIVTSRQAPYFQKPEGIFAVQRLGTYIPNITPHWRDVWYINNGVAGVLVKGRLYANILSGIDMVRGIDGQLNDEPYLVHPGHNMPTEMPAAGDCYAMCRDGNYVVAAIWNQATQASYVCWGQPAENVPGQPGLTPMIWHVAPLVIEGEKVTWLEKATTALPLGGTPYLMVATTDPNGANPKLYRMSLPRNGNPLQDLASGGPWRCRTDTCTLYLSRYPGLQGAHSEKAIRQVATVSKNASGTSRLSIYVDPDESGRQQLGSDVTESPYAETRILTDISGRQLAPSVDLVAGSNTTPPILRALTVWAGEGVKATTTYTGRFRFGTGIVLRNGAKDTEIDPQAQWELLKAAQGPRPATLTDWKGTSYVVAIEQGAIWKEREIASGERYEIDFSMKFTVLGQSATYQGGYVYDSEATYAS